MKKLLTPLVMMLISVNSFSASADCPKGINACNTGFEMGVSLGKKEAMRMCVQVYSSNGDRLAEILKQNNDIGSGIGGGDEIRQITRSLRNLTAPFENCIYGVSLSQ